jgi:hypothetical protein
MVCGGFPVMVTVPANYTWLNDEIPNFRQMNARLSDMANFLLNPPMVRLRRTTTFNIAASTTTPIPWDFVEYENTNMWDATAATKLKPSVAGWYVGSAGVSYDNNSAGYRETDIRKNGSGTDRVLRNKTDAWNDSTQTVVSRGHLFLEFFNGTTDYIEVCGFQSTGATLAINVGSYEQMPEVSLRWVGN